MDVDEMTAVIIGMDPHKRSATIEVMSGDESILGNGRYATDVEGYKEMLRFAKRFPQQTLASRGRLVDLVRYTLGTQDVHKPSLRTNASQRMNPLRRKGSNG